jgi:hypothetical protein
MIERAGRGISPQINRKQNHGVWNRFRGPEVIDINKRLTRQVAFVPSTVTAACCFERAVIWVRSLAFAVSPFRLRADRLRFGVRSFGLEF